MLSRPLARIAAAALGAVIISTVAGGVAGHAGAAPTPSPTPSAPSNGAPSSSKATFGLQPYTPGRPDLRSQFSYQMSAGGTFTDNVAVVNFGPQPLSIDLYTADLDNSNDGNLAVAAENAPSSDAGAWVSLKGGKQSVTLPASSTKNGPGRVILPITVKVPPSAAPGDHGAAVVASLVTLGRNPKGENVRLLQRIALRVFIRVNGDIRPHLSVTGLSMKYKDNWNPIGAGSTELTYTLRNDGNVKLGARQQISVSGWFGSTGSLAADLVGAGALGKGGPTVTLPDIPVLLPGSAVVVHQRIAHTWPEIRLTAKVKVIPLREATDANSGNLAPTTKTVSTWAIPWVLLAIIVVLIGGATAFWLWLRRRRKRYSGGSHKLQKRKPNGPVGTNGQRKSKKDNKTREPVGTALRVIASVVALVAAATAVTARATADNGVPFTDSNQNGYLGFCNTAGHQVTSGKIGDAPFAALAVSSTAAPEGYGAGYGKAQLNVYIPRENTEPREWTGKGLTASSTFTNTAHPMAEGTVLDAALVDLTSVAKPKWQGLVQLRMYFSAINRPQHMSPYPATVIRVTGDSWTVVSGGAVDCHAGKATSVERVALPASAFSSAARKTPTPPPASSGSKSNGTGSSTSSSGLPGDDTVANASKSTSSSGSAAVIWTLVGVAVAAGAGFGVWRWRRLRAG